MQIHLVLRQMVNQIKPLSEKEIVDAYTNGCTFRLKGENLRGQFFFMRIIVGDSG